MAHDLITQVRSDDEDNHDINLDSNYARNAHSNPSPSQDPDEKETQPSCCWRFWCGPCKGKKPTKADNPPRTQGTSGGGGKADGKSGPPPQSQQLPPVTQQTQTVPTHMTAPPPAATYAHPSPNGGPSKKYLLPPLNPEHKGRKTLVLDLDETLVHSSFKPIPNADFVISIELENVIHRVYVRKRPGVDNFLRHISDKFEVVVFTASLAKYADPLLDILDRNKIVHTRLFREACVQHYGNYVKDLSHLGRPLEGVIIVDNSPFSYMFQPDNAIPITSWFNDKNDRQLYDLLPFLDSIMSAEDVCQILQRKRLSFMNGPQAPQQ